MALDCDALVVGSGFGGAVTACRLAAAGCKVIVLERGRRWTVADFPRKPDDQWIWDDANPVARHGWFDFRVFPNMSVVQGAGVGGGSLVYANVSILANPDTFDAGWPPEITYNGLKPHYDTVGNMLGVARVPANQWPERTRLLREGAEKAGFANRFRQVELAVTFDETWPPDAPDRYDPRHSKKRINQHGVEQGTCVHLGNCDIGCDVNARNTLDLNYLAVAERHGAEIRPLHIVQTVAPILEGYRISFEKITNGQLIGGQLTAKYVVLAAGSLGSTGILLRSRAGGMLPNVSQRLGLAWSSNGDFLTPALHMFRQNKPMPTRGPTITAAVDLLDGEYMGRPLFVEDGGLPDFGRNFLEELVATPQADPRAERLKATLLPLLADRSLFDSIMPWFAQARDAADGRLSLKNGRLWLDWDIKASEETINAVASIHRKMAYLTEGLPLTPLTWTIGRDLITPHPLGGCNMGTSAVNGVVDYKGEVFNYPRLFVADGSIIPKAIGLNPSRTIAALAEHIAGALVAIL
jgi:cholesterol oxidase